MGVLAVETIQKTNQESSSAISGRAVEYDQIIVLDFIDNYGNFIWALAKRFTNSNEEAEAATREIFTDIWKYAENGFKVRIADKITVAMIARRRLIKRLRESNNVYVSNR